MSDLNFWHIRKEAVRLLRLRFCSYGGHRFTAYTSSLGLDGARLAQSGTLAVTPANTRATAQRLRQKSL